jgi:outer membrane protein
MKNSMLTWCWNAVVVPLLLLSLPAGGTAQGKEPSRPDEKPGNSLERLFLKDYAVPQVRSFDLRSEESLDALIQDGKLALSDEDAIRLALQNNVDINVERYTPYFTLWDIEKGRAVLNPSLAFSTSVNRLVTPATSALQGGQTLLNLNAAYNMTYHKPFEPGLDLDVGFNTTRNRTSSFFNSVNPSFTPNLSFQLTQHLLKDYGRTTRGRLVRIARNNLSISEETFDARVSDIITSVLNTYWDLVYAEEDIKVQEASRKLAEVVLQQNKIQAEVGTMAPLDVIQAEAEVAARTEALVVSRYTRKTTEDQLKKLISSRTDPGAMSATLETLSKPEPPPPPVHTVKDAIQRAMDNRPEVNQILMDQENKKIQLDFTKNQLKPTLDLVAGYSQNGLGGDQIIRDYSQGFFGAPIIDFVPGGFWDSLDSLFSRRYLGYVVGLSLQIPLGNSDARASSAQAQIDFRQGEEKLRSQRQRIALEIRQAYDNIAMNRERVSTAEVTVRYQQQRLQGEQDKYALGATTTRFILEAQRDLQDAQSRLLKAKIDLIKSRIALDRALGDTLQAHNIQLEDALRPFK